MPPRPQRLPPLRALRLRPHAQQVASGEWEICVLYLVLKEVDKVSNSQRSTYKTRCDNEYNKLKKTELFS
ncbi:MAG TPA: hypothetical protein PLL08_04020 [Bacteroidales bacterium]|nr:hypothetical protein [Bacteroidales bacterium]HXK74060.1 hypothetical protein [Bacteroidales bacterium]